MDLSPTAAPLHMHAGPDMTPHPRPATPASGRTPYSRPTRPGRTAQPAAAHPGELVVAEATHIAGALAWLEAAAPERAGTLMLREQFDLYRTTGRTLAQWTQLRQAADSLMRTWNPFLPAEQPDPLAALLYARLSTPPR